MAWVLAMGVEREEEKRGDAWEGRGSYTTVTIAPNQQSLGWAE